MPSRGTLRRGFCLDLCTYRSATCRLYVGYWHQVTWNLLKRTASVRQVQCILTLFYLRLCYWRKFNGAANNELTMHRAIVTIVFNQHLQDNRKKWAGEGSNKRTIKKTGWRSTPPRFPTKGFDGACWNPTLPALASV